MQSNHQEAGVPLQNAWASWRVDLNLSFAIQQHTFWFSCFHRNLVCTRYFLAESCRASIRLGFHRAAYLYGRGEKKMNGRDSLWNTIRRPVNSDFCGGEPQVHHIYVYDTIQRSLQFIREFSYLRIFRSCLEGRIGKLQEQEKRRNWDDMNLKSYKIWKHRKWEGLPFES
jgi:hypothetical protein